jgi:hypothetical protein
MVSELLIFNTEPRWDEKVELKKTFQRELKLQGVRRALREHFDAMLKSQEVYLFEKPQQQLILGCKIRYGAVGSNPDERKCTMGEIRS